MSADYETEHFKGWQAPGEAITFAYKPAPGDIWAQEGSLGAFTREDLEEMLSMFNPPAAE